MSLKSVINEHYNNLSDIELHILEFILKQEIDYEDLTINFLSQMCNVSTTSIHRTVKKLGFSGFSDFKYYMINNDLKRNQKSELIESNYKQLIVDNIILTLDAINNDNLEALLQLIYSSNVRYAYGTGWKQGAQLQAFSNDLLTYDKSLIQIRALTDLKLMSERMNRGDLFIISSLSGNTERVAEIVRYLTLKGVNTVSFTSFGINEISKAATLNFYYQDDNYDDGKLPWPAMTLKALQDYIVYRYFMFNDEQRKK